MTNSPKYWKSLQASEENYPDSKTEPHEFMDGVTDDFSSSEQSGMSRKQFLALLAASAAFTSAGCSDYRDKGEIIPYTKKPEEVTPGVPNYYASTCTVCSQICGILIKTREGRPIKIDGNPDHPVNRGKICAKGQASILNLYDPFRLRTPRYGSALDKQGDLSWKQIDDTVTRSLDASVQNGKEIAILTRAINSPTTKKLLNEFKAKYPTTKVYSYSLFNTELRRKAWHKCYGSVELPVIEWEKAKIILALESDFLGTEGMVIEQICKFTDARDIMKSKKFNRLYCVEGTMSLTGANADYRLRLRPDAQLEFVLALAKELGDHNISSALSLQVVAQKYGLSNEVLQHLIDDLKSHRGEAMIYAGNMLQEEVHIAVNYLNDLLGNTKLFKKDSIEVQTSHLSSFEEMETLINGMKSGSVGIIVHFDSNPIYHLPKEFGYKEALKFVPLTISLVEAEDETSRHCTFMLPINQAFESWGDYQTRNGILSLQQPVIAPLYDTRQKEAVLLSWINRHQAYTETIYHEYLMSRWEKEVFPLLRPKVDFKTFWYSSVHDGIVEFYEPVKSGTKFYEDALISISTLPVSGIALALTESHFLGDGSYANNGWLQELPDPISKIVWDNYAAISPSTAKALNLDNNNVVEIRLPQGSAALPILLQPGQADNFISVSLGYGRKHAGPVGNSVGVNVNQLMSKPSLNGSRVFSGAMIIETTGKYELISTQEHHSLDNEFTKDLHLKRKIVREGTLAEFERNPKFLHEEKTELFNIVKEVEYHGLKWGMAIDLNKCVGCNACVAGCGVENNIPVVGKEQVARGREMQWIRIDRYYSGTDAAPSLSHQPMLCQQCDNAPCENVCPVAATNHSPDGLNQMVYNRCVGTKYCANNCPYKVRRFNFFNWRNDFADGYYEQSVLELVNNPEVTVRSRGVMEKCTFCIQRIMEARQHAVEHGRAMNGNNVKTACQEACPATAIIFGDVNDPNSDIHRYRNHDLGYHVLEEINIRPNITYLAKLKNL